MRHAIGDVGRLAREVPTLCCNWSIPAGAQLKITKRTSQQPGRPRTVFVLVDEQHGHRVRLSKIWFEGELQ